MKKLFVLLAFLGGFASSLNAKLNVVVTTPDLAAIAQEIGGQRIEITTLARPTEDPHFVEAKPSYIVKLNRADALIEGGAELEIGWLPPLLEGARNPRLAHGKPGRILGSEGIHLLGVPEELDRSKGDVHAAGNPHYLTNPDNAQVVAEHIAHSLAALDPGSAQFFQSNLEKFKRRLDAKIAEWERLLAPHKGKQVVAYHNYWPYFAERFGLKMDLFLEPKPGIPPSASHLASVIAQMKTAGIKVVVVQPYLNRRTAETVAKNTGATLIDAPTFPNPAKGIGYIEWLDTIVTSVAKALAS